ncbi:MAG: serine/threonine protein kinase [Gemmatimonadetes bacterium]|nr:serine/threonine protein kinase [Gemmatimonadota bacterium]
MRDAPSVEFLALQEVVAGRYSLDRELGRGGMGIVFLARDVALDRPVAIKLFPPELALDVSLRERFLREARTAAKLSHPNIVPIHAVEEHEDLVFFVMTFVDGETLTQRIAARGPLPVRDGVRVLREVAWALVQAHSQGIVHRDIKADNILLERGSGRAMVTDFGIAKVSGVGHDTDEHEIMGTPEFMSPEQATGEAVDHRTDIYSLGVVAFLTLSGRMPFEGTSASEILAHHIRTPAPRLHTVAPGVPSKLSGLVDKCLAKRPSARIANANDLAEALGAALETRRELPVAVRLFVEETKRGRDQSRGLAYTLAFLFGVSIAIPVMMAGPPAAKAVGLAVLGLLAGGPAWAAARRIRRVLAAGYDREDIVHAFNRDIAARHEELAFLYGPDYAVRGAKLRKIAYGAFATAGVGIVGLIGFPDAAPFFGLLVGASALVGISTGLPADKRSDRKARRSWKFWKGRIGRWLFRVARVGLAPPAQATALTHRPTEIAVGIAIASLYESLPKEARHALPDLQDVARGLEDDAQRMRERVNELNQLLEESGDAESDPAAETADTLAGQRHRAAKRIGEQRDEAQQRFRDTVAALETLRVDLLKMLAGSTTLSSVTTNLGNARELAADIDRLLEGQVEVRELLGE